jgi:hypothetical protein
MSVAVITGTSNLNPVLPAVERLRGGRVYAQNLTVDRLR